MVSGSNSRNKTKSKGKLVFAKDRKQASIAIIVVLLFLGNSIYMIAKYAMEQFAQPTPPPQASLDSKYNPANPSRTKDPDTYLHNGTNPADTSTLNSNNPNMPPNSEVNGVTTDPLSAKTPNMDPNSQKPNEEAPAPPPIPTQSTSSSGFNPLTLIFIILTLVGLGYGAYKKMPQQRPSKSAAKSVSKKGSGNKGKLVFAKDNKQAALALIVVLLFIGNSIYMAIKYFISQNAAPVSTQTVSDPILERQQKNLSALDNTNPSMDSQPTNLEQDSNNIYSQTLSLQGSPEQPSITPNPSSSGDDEIEIISKKDGSVVPRRKEKMVLISVLDSGRSNPFLPASENLIPSSLPRLNSSLMSPPETIPANSDAGRIMTTTISGILYDKYNPSAIINIEGSDYLVKVGDVINHYKVLAIGKTEVIVQLGKNVYKAGVGELLSQTNINYNNIANLNKKFGGNEIQISVKKKSY